MLDKPNYTKFQLNQSFNNQNSIKNLKLNIK